PTRVDFVRSTGVLLSAFEASFDRMGNRRFERRIHDGSKGDNYAYDSTYRLTTFEREVPAADVGVLRQGHQQHRNTWKLDGVDDWRVMVADSTTTNLGVNNLCEYTAVGTATPAYDPQGNLKSPNSSAATPVSYQYDFLNRLRIESAGSQIVAFDY